MERRRFLSLLTAGLSALLGAALTVPLLGQILAPLRRARGGDRAELNLGPLESFPLGTPQRVAFELRVRDGWLDKSAKQAAWVERLPEDGVRVFTTVCPHLGCSVEWRGKSGAYECPCHDSNFAPDGVRQRGPARRGLDELPARVVEGQVMIRWVEFVPGIAERKALGGELA